MELLITDHQPLYFPGIMKLEECYPPGLQEGEKSKSDLIELADVQLWMWLNNELVGECLGIRLSTLLHARGEREIFDSWQREKDWFKAVYGASTNEENIIYCYATAILPKHRGRGFGRWLKQLWLREAKIKGYKLAVGHSTSNAIDKINLGFGRHCHTIEDWCGYGHKASYYVIVL